MQKPPKNFSAWNIDLVKYHFHIQRVENLPELTEWLAAKPNVSAEDRFFLEKPQKRLRQNGIGWNEAELGWYFLTFVLYVVDFKFDDVSPFCERKLSAEINGHTVGGVVDWMVAVGEVDPRHPFFFIHEYKPQTDPKGDPLGQLLIEMLAAQTLNGDELMYGSYVIGANWYFVVLKGKEFAVSEPYIATNDQLYQIVGFLQAQKRRVEKWLETADLYAV